MTVIRPNSVSGITSITAQANEINFFRSNGTLAGLQLNGVNFNTTTGVSTFNNLDVGGVLTYQDVTNVDSVGIITARSTIDAQGDVSIVDKIIHTGDTNTAIRFPANDTISFETSGGERLKITSTGLIYVNGDGTGGRIDATAGDGSMTFSDGNGRQTLKIKTMGSGQSAAHVFDANGRLGIGTDTPTYPLQVHDSSAGGLLRLLSGHEGNYDLRFVYQNSEANIWSYASSDMTVGTRYARKLHLVTNGPSKRLTIDDGGRVGIGTISPSAKLEVRDPSSSGIIVRSDNTQTTDSNKALRVRNNSDTNTFSVSHKGLLEVNRGELGTYLKVGGDNANNGRALTFTSANTGSNGALHTINATSGNGAIALATSGTERFRVEQNGYITMPFRPAFKCHIDTQASPNSGVVSENNGFTLNATSYRDAFNTGSHFSEATGRFTAPVTGLYFFHFSLMRFSNNGNGSYDIRIKKNNSLILARSYKAGYTQNFESLNVTTITNMTGGHYVTFNIGSSMSVYEDDSYMLGYLLG